MSAKDDELIELFRKITYVHFLTDYSSIDFQYPPIFVWDKFNNERFAKIKKNFSSGDYLFYAHFPFCQSKCKFCRQFSLAVNKERLYKEYIDFIIQELRLYTETIDISSLVHIYLGGGTPTLFPLDIFFELLHKYTHVDPIAQINVESTPESLNYKKLKLLKKWGVSRLLIGLQSLDPRVLRLINRPQQKSHFIRNYYFAKEIGIPVINLELVAGLPGQTLKSFLDDLNSIIKMKPESIHIYGYLNTPVTIFYKENYRKKQKEQELQNKMKKEGKRILKEANYFYQGDDYCLDNKSSSRNLALARPDCFSHSKALGTIALGLSAVGSLALNNGYLLKTINTMDYENYKENLQRKRFPITKSFLRNREDKRRYLFMRGYRYGVLEGKRRKKPELYLGRAIKYLKRQGKIKIQRKGENIKIIFSPDGDIIHHKIFYSPKVLKKCQKILAEQYPEVTSSDIDF
jgi:oxygen-independent coproporphyrinogen-3 oxidase